MIQFSVVIPLYNKKQHIERAINSVINQNYKEFEIIIVNDGSVDGGKELVSKKYQQQVRLINQDNQGVSVARNTGVFESKNDYVCLLDADDEWKPHFLEDIAKLIRLYPNHNIYSLRHEIITEDGQLIKPRSNLPEHYIGIIDNFIDAFRKSGCIINSSSVCLKKDFFHKIGGFPAGQSQGEDVYLWILYGVYTKLVYSNRIGSCYYRNTVNSSSSNIKENKLPFHFSHFYRILNITDSETRINKYRKELLKFLYKDALLHTAYLKSRKRHKIALSHSALFYRHNKKTGFVCFLITLLPSCFFTLIKNIRNLKRNTA